MSAAPKLEIYYKVFWNIKIQLSLTENFVHNPGEVDF